MTDEEIATTAETTRALALNALNSELKHAGNEVKVMFALAGVPIGALLGVLLSLLARFDVPTLIIVAVLMASANAYLMYQITASVIEYLESFADRYTYR